MSRGNGSSGYPRLVKAGNVVVKIYRLPHRNTKGGWLYQVTYRDVAGKRHTPQFADPVAAETEARLKAAQLAEGKVEAADMGRADRDELLALRRICGDVPPLSAVQEWAKAREMTDGHLLAAAKAWAAGNEKKFNPALASECVDLFIKATEEAGGQGERTYRAKLNPIKTYFAGRELHTISAPEWGQYLGQWKDGVTRNDFRKRASTLCRWAQANGYLPRGVDLEVSATKRAVENPPEIGLALPETFGRLLLLLREEHPQHLAALVLAGFAGVRSDEIHGKRENRDKRQVWEDVYLSPERIGGRKQKPYVQISVAKKNTPAWRDVPLCPAAVEWLALCPEPHQGAVCIAGAMEHVRRIGINAGLDLPENCFRHSFISYQIAITGNKPQVATWAGTSLTQIDKHYRRPVAEARARAWFEMTPGRAAHLGTKAHGVCQQGA